MRCREPALQREKRSRSNDRDNIRDRYCLKPCDQAGDSAAERLNNGKTYALAYL
ncbi:hypothetical protein QE443_001490 [Pantoea ananatis]|uniref:hypothetical protein n=1 Tax=Pantoea ananas TaxID=553 RepID=UPI00278A4FA9|nr:hypothetical protein [Pantoea ananatis]MDQ1225329.1 hypothetical protein [Pantoea ananatis]